MEQGGEYYEEYMEEENYYGDYYKNNNKKDAGATRFKKIPVHRVTLETVIPDEPQEKKDKPNDHSYEKKLKEITESIEKHTKNKEDLYVKIKEERIGKSPEIVKLFEESKALAAELLPITNKINELNTSLTVPLAESKKLKAKRTAIEKEIEIKDYDRLTHEIESIQEKLGFGMMSAKEEQNLMIKKRKLENQAPKVKELKDIRDRLTKLNAENKASFDILHGLNKKKDDLFEKKKAVHAKIDALKLTVKENQPAIEQLNVQITNIKETIAKLNQEYYATEQEWTKKWKEFEAYMEIVENIRECKKKQNDIRKHEDKMKKKAEKEAKKEGANKDGATVEINCVKSDDTLETFTLKSLITFFKNLLPKSETEVKKQETTTNTVSDKINEDMKKGLITIMDREAINKEQVLGIASTKKEKKEKGPKVSKRDQKLMSTDLLILGVDIISQIKELNLVAPNKKGQVEAFVQTLEKKLETAKSSTVVSTTNN